jgi:hypothetical protein
MKDKSDGRDALLEWKPIMLHAFRLVVLALGMAPNFRVGCFGDAGAASVQHQGKKRLRQTEIVYYLRLGYARFLHDMKVSFNGHGHSLDF